ncbi:hypothetical protein N9739_00340 [Burkholderiaceae bacterium]|nr:hypothetical protein [Burkholderiaceae bacterium]
MSQEIKNTVYCTIFDDNYLARALALYESLMRVNEAATFAFFCIDAKSAGLLTALKLERSIVVTHDEFATAELLGLRADRSKGEYCWTCKPFALLYLMRNVPAADWVVYVDTDMMFFADPDEALPGPDAHYLLAPHGFHSGFAAHEKSAGRHNAGYVAARCSKQGEQATGWWKDRCVESCSVIPTDTTFADQKYLDQFSELFPFGASARHKGLNVAPWNVENFSVETHSGRVYVDDVPLLLYHFQGLQLFDNGTASLYIGDMRIRDVLRVNIYEPHLLALLRAFASIKAVDPAFASGLGKQRKYLGNVFKRAFKTLTKSGNVVPFQVT